MSYAKEQEYRMKEWLEKHDFQDIRYYGSREKNAGDFLAKYNNKYYRFDHKSSHRIDGIKIQHDWIKKLSDICLARTAEPLGIPVISLSYINSHIYMIIPPSIFYVGRDAEPPILTCNPKRPLTKSCHISNVDLELITDAGLIFVEFWSNRSRIVSGSTFFNLIGGD